MEFAANCKVCNHTVSSHAAKCPNCHADWPAPHSHQRDTLRLFFNMVVIAAIFCAIGLAGMLALAISQ